MKSASVLLAGVAALAGCSARGHSPAVQPAVATFTATDYAFAGPAQVPAGTVTIRLVNNGREPHHAMVARLQPGKTAGDLLAFYQEQLTSDPTLKNDPPWATYVGGVTIGGPGESFETVSVLDPGQYAVICFVPSPDRQPHLAKGMVIGFEVTHNDAHAEPPAADVEVVLNDYGFAFSEPLTAGRHVLRVRNDGPQIHEMQLVRLEPGASAAQFLARVAHGGEGALPGRFMGGMGALGRGLTGYWTVDLEPGTYVLLCFVPDYRDGAPHIAHGMMRELTVT